MEVRTGCCGCILNLGIVTARHTEATLTGGCCAGRLKWEGHAYDRSGARHRL